MNKYRIVTDNYCGFEVQKKFLFFFWVPCSDIYSGINTFHNIEQCEKFINSLIEKKHKKMFKSKVVKVVNTNEK